MATFGPYIMIFEISFLETQKWRNLISFVQICFYAKFHKNQLPNRKSQKIEGFGLDIYIGPKSKILQFSSNLVRFIVWTCQVGCTNLSSLPVVSSYYRPSKIFYLRFGHFWPIYHDFWNFVSKDAKMKKFDKFCSNLFLC